MRIGWLVILTQVLLASYALRAICRQIGRDRRCPSRDRIIAYGVAMALTADKRYSFVTEWLYVGCIASSFVAALAIRILQGDGAGNDRR